MYTKIEITQGEYTGRTISPDRATISIDGRRCQVWFGRDLIEFMFGVDCRWVITSAVTGQQLAN